MLDIIRAELEEVAGPEYNINCEYKADNILDAIEKAGMIPPSYQIFHNRKGIGGAVASTRVDREWEPEDGEES